MTALPLADISTIVATAPIAFAVGWAVGLFASSRYRLVRRDEPPADP